MTPIHKKGDRGNPGNYRPVSLTAVTCKILESIIREKIMDHMVTNRLFCDEQHGFVPGRSCMTQLLTCIDDWTAELDVGNPLDAVYLDFQKAFDTVPHQRLIYKVESYGIGKSIVDWIRDFLTDRRQRVALNGHFSQWSDVTSGIPQGSVLGPLLFVIYINDLPEAVVNTVRIFADDTKLYGPVTTDDERELMQKDLNNLSEWSNMWLLKFNASKCSVMHLGHNNPGHQYFMTSKNSEMHQLGETETEKDLGLYVDCKLNFHHHVDVVTAKASRILGLIKRTFVSRSKDIIKRLFTALVRPTLEYGNSARPTTQFVGDMDKLERVQRRATKLCTELRDLPYEQRLKEMNLPSMYYRKERGDMIQVFKIITQKDKIDNNILPRKPPDQLRGHKLKLVKRRGRLDTRIHSFGYRVTNSWNNLPEWVVNSGSLNLFKTNLDSHWKFKRYRQRPPAYASSNVYQAKSGSQQA